MAYVNYFDNSMFDTLIGPPDAYVNGFDGFDGFDGRPDAPDGRPDGFDSFDAADGRPDAPDGRPDAADGRLDAPDGRPDDNAKYWGIYTLEIINMLPPIMSSNFPDMPTTWVHKVSGKRAPHVKRPQNSFMCFAQRNRAKFRDDRPDTPNASISILLGQAWRAMDAAARKPYVDAARAEAVNHKENHPDYKYGDHIRARRKAIIGATV